MIRSYEDKQFDSTYNLKDNITFYKYNVLLCVTYFEKYWCLLS